ncbi:acetyl-CoA carboxylase biotin carboxyl carrier protein subunit [Cupriavidus metallidurans]|uniref:acetyl-CoA carboxylase biotin carboxyl carrier protein subunit n=1 Tax=Cupriavidus TaxID=106589 RepID=UPI00056CA29C|nr:MULTISPECIES: acetyl-CoA carboxylase biotin carboxyl carrier protein subunit [Cupriavidus]GMG89971.1 biotin attachment protein [Cupriavidus sp. TKC]HBD38987.1 acetyl-CoA carboxylase biotin carboxyl carrier protein subunit [Cupriavidus sp.]HBO81343.1 acetyl-CoA carboxylase biotin carboxyl carrier protein subunit [Cupriavidus sp.]
MLTICSPLAGRVVAHCTNPDGSVQAGDPLLIVESMKMEIPVEAEASGTVARYLVEVGADIAEGQPVVEMR